MVSLQLMLADLVPSSNLQASNHQNFPNKCSMINSSLKSFVSNEFNRKAIINDFDLVLYTGTKRGHQRHVHRVENRLYGQV